MTSSPSISPHFCVLRPSIFTPFFPIRFDCMFYYPRLFTCITRLTHPHPRSRSRIAPVQPSHFVPSSSQVHTTSLPPFSPTESTDRTKEHLQSGRATLCPFFFVTCIKCTPLHAVNFIPLLRLHFWMCFYECGKVGGDVYHLIGVGVHDVGKVE